MNIQNNHHFLFQETQAFLHFPLVMAIIINFDGTIYKTDQSIHPRLGWTSDEMIGQPISSIIHPQDLSKSLMIFEQLISGSQKIIQGMQIRCLGKNGEYVWTSWSAQVKDGKIYALGDDITDSKQKEQLLNILTERLGLAVKAGNIGIWEWVPGTENLKWDATVEASYGYAPGTFPGTTAAYNEAIHPSDREKHWQEVSSAIEARTSFSNEYRIIRQDGKIRWLHGSGMAFYDEANKPVLMIGTCQDVTTRRQFADDQIFLSKISEILSISFNYRDTFLSMANDATEYFCDGCYIDLFHPEGHVERIVDIYPDSLMGSQIQVKNYSSIAVYELENPLLNWSDLGNSKSIIAKQLKGRERLLGRMTFFNVQDSIKVFDERIPQFTDELSFRASMALENSLLYENLLEAVKARDQFISIASHELKTPLTSLSLQNQMRELFLNKNNSEPFSKQDYLKMLSADYYQLQRINRLIDDMLDISRIRGGHLHLDKEYFGLRFFVNDVVQRFYPQVEACGGQVLIDQGQEINVKVDAFRIEQVLINLLTNAVKYSPGSPIKIEFQTLSSSVRVLIHDEGPGIPLEDQDRIFLRFERSVANHVVSGLGLGLYISREIMQQHNGTLSVKSEPGHGSTFILEFPL